MRYGSMFSGVGGLDLAVESHYGAEAAWHAEQDPACAAILERHWPGVPNHGDVTKIDWEQVPSVDIICGGFPCQDISYAGRGAGLDGDRSGLYWHLWEAVRVVRPSVVVLENVAAVLVRGGPAIVASLADLGYVCRWGVVRAVDAGAPHRRARWFCVADTSDEGWRQARTAEPGTGRPSRESSRTVAAQPRGRYLAPADTGGDRRLRGTQLNGMEVGPRQAGEHRGHADGRPLEARWGQYAPAIARWEAVTGEPAPSPIDGRRLNPELSRWMMGLPAGWLDGMTRTQALRAAGNAVVPQQAALALALLNPQLETSAA